VATVIASVFDPSHKMSPAVADYSWSFYSTLSIIEILLMWAAAVGLLLFAYWGAALFLAHVAYSMIYVTLFGAGSGGQIVDVLGEVHSIITGCILYAVLFTTVRSKFGKGR
jgi:hypothetical protein